MKYPLIIALLFSGLLAAALPARAEGVDSLSYKERHEAIRAMSKEERQAFFAERKAKWQAMSREEKLKEIERRRAERMSAMEAHWDKMSDDEKIAHVERKMKHMEKGDFPFDCDKHKGKKHGDVKGEHPKGDGHDGMHH